MGTFLENHVIDVPKTCQCIIRQKTLKLLETDWTLQCEKYVIYMMWLHIPMNPQDLWLMPVKFTNVLTNHERHSLRENLKCSETKKTPQHYQSLSTLHVTSIFSDWEPAIAKLWQCYIVTTRASHCQDPTKLIFHCQSHVLRKICVQGSLAVSWINDATLF